MYAVGTPVGTPVGTTGHSTGVLPDIVRFSGYSTVFLGYSTTGGQLRNEDPEEVPYSTDKSTVIVPDIVRTSTVIVQIFGL